MAERGYNFNPSESALRRFLKAILEGPREKKSRRRRRSRHIQPPFIAPGHPPYQHRDPQLITR